MTASSAVIRSYRGYFLWLTLQYLACLAVSNDNFYGEEWPVVALVAIWLMSELVARFSWKSSRRSNGPLAQSLEICYVLAGLAFQKAFFASHAVSHPLERAVSQVMAGASKLSFIFFCLPIRLADVGACGKILLEIQQEVKRPPGSKPGDLLRSGRPCVPKGIFCAGELVLLLMVDSLLQLLFFNQRSHPQRDVPCNTSLLLLADALFTALPLLLYCFGPWCAVENRAETGSHEGEKGQEGAHPAGGTTIPLSAAASGSATGGVCRGCGHEARRHLTCPSESPDDRRLESHEVLGRRKTVDTYDIVGKDRPRLGPEHSIERLLLSLVVLLSKRNDGNLGEQHNVFDEAAAPAQAEGLRKDVEICRGSHHPCREKGADRSNPSCRIDTLNDGRFASHPNSLERGPTPKPQGPKPPAVSPSQRVIIRPEARNEAAGWIGPAACSAFSQASRPLPFHHIHIPSAAGHGIYAVDTPQAEIFDAPKHAYAQVASWMTGSKPQAATGSARSEDPAGSSPVRHSHRAERVSHNLLSSLKEQLSKKNQEHQQSTAVVQPAVPIAPGDSRPMRAAAAPIFVIRPRASSQPPPDKAVRETVLLGSDVAPHAAPIFVIRPRASSQPPPDKAVRETLLLGSDVAPQNLQNAPLLLGRQRLSCDGNMVPIAIEGSKCYHEGSGLTIMKTLHQPKQGNTDGMVIVGCPRGAGSLEGTVGAALASAMGPHALAGQLRPRTEDHVSSSRPAGYPHGIPQDYVGNMIFQREQEPPLARSGYYSQHGSSGPQREDQQHQKQQQQHPVQPQKHQPGLPASMKGSSSREDKNQGGKTLPCQPPVKVPQPPICPGVLIVLRQTTPPGERGEGKRDATPIDANKQNSTPDRGIVNADIGGGTAFPLHHTLVLDPFADPDQQQKPRHSVLWGRSKAIGANGTPMISPRHKTRTSSLGAGGTASGIGAQRQSPLAFQPERHTQRSPTIAARPTKGEGSRGDPSKKDWMDRGECMHAGPKQFFGIPSVPLRDSTTQGKHAGNDGDAEQKLQAFAMWRRGRRVNTAGQESSERKPSLLPPSATHIGEAHARTQEGQARDSSERGNHLCDSRDASSDSANGMGEGLGRRLPAASLGASRADGRSGLELRSEKELRSGELRSEKGKQVPSPQPAGRSSISSSLRPIDSCCPRSSAPRPTAATAGRRQHPPVRGPQQLLDVASTSSGNSWESWDPLLPGDVGAFSLPISQEEASRLRDDASHEGSGEILRVATLFCSPRRQSLE
ncbi:hypothetical protein, conserved [Eimeria praecox]|uniref:Uncharacterized protein n=1 Tax=Eimeria praecox TaxID=51316 RepID=U6GRU5_9EIME|nr:hypothetical protein, conserved [Eimeria praecox]